MAEKEDYTKDKGDTGDPGPQGERGIQGIQGEEGPPGTTDYLELENVPTEFNPEAHKTDHQDGGTDEISVEGLAGELTAEQKSAWAKVSGKPTTFTPAAHQASHAPGGSDALVSYGTKTTAAWNKSIGAGGDYATFAAMMADTPDLIAHAVTVTIKAGTTLTEQCNILNKHGVTSAGVIIIQAEKYFPTSGFIPLADSATATTLRDATLAAAALGNDYFNGCWVFIVDGTGTDNGYVPITDYIDASGDVVVASWPGTQPDNTSRYLIVGTLISNTGTYGTYNTNSTCPIYYKGIGVLGTNLSSYGIYVSRCSYVRFDYCGVYNCVRSGLHFASSLHASFWFGGIVDNNTLSGGTFAGARIESMVLGEIRDCGVSDNNNWGIRVYNGSYASIVNNFGDLNGTWGTYASSAARASCPGTECSGSSGDHSNGVGDGSLAY